MSFDKENKIIFRVMWVSSFLFGFFILPKIIIWITS